MSYFDELTTAMTLLSEHPDTLFCGQSMVYPGNAIYRTLVNVPDEKKIELPVAEEMQMGMSIGLALEGYIPISIFPRFDFLLLAVNQLVNHLDKIGEMSHGEYSPKVIIRTAIGSVDPLYPGPQHCQDYTLAFQHLLKHIEVIKLESAKQIVPAYNHALLNSQSTLLIEKGELYGK